MVSRALLRAGWLGKRLALAGATLQQPAVAPTWRGSRGEFPYCLVMGFASATIWEKENKNLGDRNITKFTEQAPGS